MGNANVSPVSPTGEETTPLAPSSTPLTVGQIVRNPFKLAQLFGGAGAAQTVAAVGMTKEQRDAYALTLLKIIKEITGLRTRTNTKKISYITSGREAKKEKPPNLKVAAHMAAIALKLNEREVVLMARIAQLEDFALSIQLGELNEISMGAMRTVMLAHKEQMKAMGDVATLEKLTAEFAELMNDVQTQTEQLAEVSTDDGAFSTISLRELDSILEDDGDDLPPQRQPAAPVLRVENRKQPVPVTAPLPSTAKVGLLL